MKTTDFEALLKSIDEARAIKAGKSKPSRVKAIQAYKQWKRELQ